MDSIVKIATKYGLKIVEDCAEAHFAVYKGRPVASF
ncbi:DegT/DnrJ/EryC1/StrS family aminotransferase [Phascolarctobacterium faecium]